MLQIEGLRYTWPGAETPTLDVAQLRIAAGRAVFLHGPSGCGKSTLLSLMAGVLVAGPGQVRLAGQDWAALSAARRDARRAADLGVIFQQFNLLPYLSVLDNVLLPARFSAVRAARCEGGPQAAAQQLLARVALPQALWTWRADRLSVGQQQRVAAARALLGRPALVIADEPTSALDTALRDSFMTLLMGECRAAGSTLVFVSHDERLAGQFDERLSLPTINRAVQAGAAVPA